VQLVGSYVVQRPFGDFRILRLRSHRSPERTFTVGFSHSGTVTSTLVHEVDGPTGPDIDEFALTLNDSVKQVCTESGGKCTDDIEVVSTDPPRTSEAPAFLGIVDLPPIADIDKVWVGSRSEGRRNPAATQCDAAKFTGKKVRASSSRVYVFFDAKDLPDGLGVAETVGRFDSDGDAKDFVKEVDKKMADCPDDNLSANIDQRKGIDAGTTWRVGFEVNKKSRVYYRMALVRRGSDVAQVTFTPAEKYDISQKAFEALANRAAQRLVYLE
jgi:hypothetical protein